MQQVFNNFKECFGNATGGCGWKEVSYIFNDILKVLIYIGITAAALMISYAGWILLKGQGSPAARSKAKNIFLDIVIGLVLLFGAYYIVDLILVRVGFTDRAGIIQPSSQQ